MSEWRDIATAPQGRWVLVFYAVPQWMCVARHNANNVWVDRMHNSVPRPFYWMPLPDPPERATDSQSEHPESVAPHAAGDAAR